MSRDLRQFAGQTRFRLLLGALGLLFIVGLGLIYLIYGPGAALMGFLCLLIVLVPMFLIGLVIMLMTWIVKRSDEK